MSIDVNALRRRIQPSRADTLDAVAALVLIALGLIGFRAAYGGTRAIVVGFVAAAIGVAIGHVTATLRLNPVIALALALVAYVVFGGALIAPGETLLGLPTPDSFSAAVDGAMNGWAGLIRTLPLTGSGANLLAVPVVCGMAAGLLTVVLCERTRRADIVVFPAAAVLVIAVLFGTREPVSLALQGSCFTAVAMWWMSDRYERARITVRGRGAGRRLVYAGGMVLFAGVLATAIGPDLPAFSGTHRYVLRDRTQPQFDPRDYPSPLVGFRSYKLGSDADKVALRVSGLPKDAEIRLAVLDAYDGVVWGVGDDAESAGRFQRAGTELPQASTPKNGTKAFVTVEVVELSGVWVPTVGRVQTVRTSGETSDLLRYNVETGALAKPDGTLQNTLGHDTYAFDTVVPAAPDAASLSATDKRVARASIDRLPEEFKANAAIITKGAANEYDQAVTLETFFRTNGWYADDGTGERLVLSGHSLARLNQFVTIGSLEGDSEQFAATMAVYATALGLPARVVVGFRPKSDGGGATIDVRRKDFEAWVEIPFEGAGWVAFHPTPSTDKRLGSQPPPTTTTPPGGAQAKTTPPAVNPELPDSLAKPPTSTIPPCAPDDRSSSGASGASAAQNAAGVDCPSAGGGGSGALLVVLAFVGAGGAIFGLPPGLITLAKRRRRDRRRGRSDAAGRVAGAWDELMDRATDLGFEVGGGRTRRELADVVSAPGIRSLASDGDAATFGVVAPSEELVASYWKQVEDSIGLLRAGAGRTARWKAAMSLASLRKSKDRP